MNIIPRTVLHVEGARQRSTIEAKDLSALIDSIQKNGLLHPVVANENGDGRWILVAGERRLKAIETLASRGTPFVCGGEEIFPGFVPVTPARASDEIARFEAELEENITRVDLPWTDRMKALAQLHKLRLAQNPGQTYRDTSRELGDRGAAGNIEHRGRLIKRAVVVASHLSDPKIAAARTEDEAYQLVLAKEAAQYEADLLRRRHARVEPTGPRLEILPGDALTLMPAMIAEGRRFDLILTDPPYGLGAGASGYRARSVHHHNYDDTPDYARTLLEGILKWGSHLTKDRANLFMFTDIKHWDFLLSMSYDMGWTPWRTPVIWQKSITEGLVPWGRHGFAHTYDVIFFATKGSRGLSQRTPDILNYSRTSRSSRIYAAEKPIFLLQRLIELSTVPDETVLDPCAGSGSTLVAARNLKRHSVGIEIDPELVDLALVRAAKGDEAVNWNAMEKFDLDQIGQGVIE